MSKGYLSFVLHAHLPYVHHPEYSEFLEERWLFEAITETYIPILKSCSQLVEENIPFQLNISISPSLLAMLEDPLLQDRYERHISKMIELTEKEIQRNQYDPHFRWLAEYYRDLFIETRSIFVERWNKRLATAFQYFHKRGVIELMTSSATHGLLPILCPQPKTVDAQIITGLDYFENVFGFRSKGIWLPECGYFPGVEKRLAQEGIRYFITESHAIEHATTTPLHGIHTPLYTPSGVAAFGRDQGVTKEVWSAQVGFPGNPDYREFYRDIGYDLDYHYIHPYICGDIRVDTGIKYFRITGPTHAKQGYHPPTARERAAQHAGTFLHHRLGHIESLASHMETKPIIVAPFDAELFGHWWFEGPMWLDFVMRKAAFDQDSIELTTLSHYLDRHPVHQCGTPTTSTWGHKGYFDYWVNSKTDWIYPQLYACGNRMEDLAKKYSHKKIPALTKRALNQCMRELLLAQSSDWPFIINNGTSEEYAARRFRDHISRFNHLSQAIESGMLEATQVEALEIMDNIFPDANFELYA